MHIGPIQFLTGFEFGLIFVYCEQAFSLYTFVGKFMFGNTHLINTALIRIGAATAAAQAAVPDSVIQSLGCWSSSAFLRHIRTPREHLAQLSRVIST